MASKSVVPERKQRIAFRIVTGATSRWNVVLGRAETANHPINAITRIAHEVNDVSVSDAALLHVSLMHKNHFPRSINAAQPVLVPIDRCIELIVASHRDQSQHAVAALRQIRILGKT